MLQQDLDNLRGLFISQEQKRKGNHLTDISRYFRRDKRGEATPIKEFSQAAVMM